MRVTHPDMLGDLGDQILVAELCARSDEERAWAGTILPAHQTAFAGVADLIGAPKPCVSRGDSQ
jgi:hypothetical protein